MFLENFLDNLTGGPVGFDPLGINQIKKTVTTFILIAVSIAILILIVTLLFLIKPKRKK